MGWVTGMVLLILPLYNRIVYDDNMWCIFQDPEYALTLSFISAVGCFISLLGLLATIICHGLVWRYELYYYKTSLVSAFIKLDNLVAQQV